MRAPLLVELVTEELPPKALRRLGEAFALKTVEGLADKRLTDRRDAFRWFATPRRLAVLVPQVAEVATDVEREIQGPSTTAPAQAVSGFARKAGVPVETLQKQRGPKGEVYVARVSVQGEKLDAVLGPVVEAALKALPVPKLMRWGAGEAQFVRPVHALVMLHGARTVRVAVLGIRSGNTTRGHRFLGQAEIPLAHAEEYEARLIEQGKVLPDFAARRAEIERQLKAEAARSGANLGPYEDLLDEVTALVEQPAVYAAGFDPVFLEVPQECLILTMRQNQKYFPLFDAAGRLRPSFLIVSNMRIGDPRHIIAGNERVVRPRLEDARFFYNQDRRTRLEARVPELARVVYHGKLGSQLERVERIQLLAGHVARALGADPAPAERAAWLAKADLLTGMVGEFPELQGIMGRYYALHDGEAAEVADAIEAHYRPRQAGDRLPEGSTACAVALADKLDTLAGLFGVGQAPTGDKDPFGLRRAALGLIRILVEQRLPLELADLVVPAFAQYRDKREIGDARAELETFIFDRARGYFREAGYTVQEVEAVLCLSPGRLDLVPAQLQAVRAFATLPEAESLAAANKRVGNILKQAKDEALREANAAALKEPAERALFDALRASRQSAAPLFERGDYTGYLRAFAALKAPVDAFFESVMVMAEEEALRRNRLALLRDLRESMNRIADLSKLAT